MATPPVWVPAMSGVFGEVLAPVHNAALVNINTRLKNYEMQDAAFQRAVQWDRQNHAIAAQNKAQEWTAAQNLAARRDAAIAQQQAMAQEQNRWEREFAFSQKDAQRKAEQEAEKLRLGNVLLTKKNESRQEAAKQAEQKKAASQLYNQLRETSPALTNPQFESKLRLLPQDYQWPLIAARADSQRKQMESYQSVMNYAETIKKQLENEYSDKPLTDAALLQDFAKRKLNLRKTEFTDKTFWDKQADFELDPQTRKVRVILRIQDPSKFWSPPQKPAIQPNARPETPPQHPIVRTPSDVEQYVPGTIVIEERPDGTRVTRKVAPRGTTTPSQPAPTPPAAPIPVPARQVSLPQMDGQTKTRLQQLQEAYNKEEIDDEALLESLKELGLLQQ